MKEGDSGSGHGVDGHGRAGAGSLADALEQAIASARADQLEQLDRDVELQNVLADAGPGGKPAGQLGEGRGPGLPTGRMPDRGVDRPPYPDEVQHARRYANRLRQALTHGTRQIDKRTPGGRFYGRAGSMGSYEYALGPVACILTDGLRQIGGAGGRPGGTPPIADATRVGHMCVRLSTARCSLR